MAKRSKTIDAYRAKRDFTRTPEPPPEAPKPVLTLSFVVHRHEARRLHYDLRLEMDGVLKSWAIPRGFSYDPQVKKLAVRTEDHPLAYVDFDGVIPKGEYGGGTMTIWDRGHYQLVKADDGPAAVDAGKLEIELRGQKLRGEWHLVRTRSEKDEWILFKARDRYVREETDKQPFFDLSRALATSLPEPVEPMLFGMEAGPFSDPDWLFEVEFSGRRVQLRKEDQEIRIVDLAGNDLAPHLPEITEQARRMRVESVLADGVLVATDEGQRPSAEKLAARLEGSEAAPVSCYLFDALYYEEWDIRALPLTARKEILSALLLPSSQLLYVDHVRGRGEDFSEVTRSAGLPAVLAKKASSPYASGPSEEWRRIPTGREASPQDVDLAEALKSSGPKGRRIPFTNLDKVFWPEEGYTKGDLIRYYDQVAEVLIPYLYERPMHMLRYPDGIHGKYFYQKDAPDHVPEWIEIEEVPSDSKGEPIRFIVCNERDTLVYIANLGSIDLHPWFSRRGSLDTPDWAIFDLDPDGSPFADVVKVARSLGKVLRGIGLRPYLKTSGATGLHVYVPVNLAYTYDQTRQFCEAISRYVAADQKDIATVERVVSRRRGKVYIDFLQNRRGQTIVPAYVVRPQPKAPVSAPLEWDELDTELNPADFNIRSILERIDKYGDLFEGALRDKQDLFPAIEAFQRNYLKG